MTPDAPYTGTAVTLKLPTPLDPTTLDVWGRQLNEQGFAPLTAAINSIIAYLNGDTTPVVPISAPVVAIAAPVVGAVLAGTFAISARIIPGSSGIASVSAFLGSDKLADLTYTTSNTWTAASIDSSRFTNGVVTITVRATDALGNVGSDALVVVVLNVPVVDPTILTTEAGSPLTTEAGDPLVITVGLALGLLTEAGSSLTTEAGDHLIFTAIAIDPALAASLLTESGDALISESSARLVLS